MLTSCASVQQSPQPPILASDEEASAASPDGDAARSTAAALAALSVDHYGRLNAVIAIDPTAMEQARSVDELGKAGPRVGKLILIKDNVEVSAPGLATTAGSLALKDNV